MRGWAITYLSIKLSNSPLHLEYRDIIAPLVWLEIYLPGNIVVLDF